MLAVFALLVVILYQYQLIQSLSNINSALRVERRMAAESIAEVASGLQQKNSSQPADLASHILTLNTAAVLLGGGPAAAGGGVSGSEPGEGEGEGEVCPEKYRGNTDWPLQYNSWQEEDCEYGQEVGQLVSLVFRGETRQQVERVSQSVWRHYPGVPVIIRAPAQLELELEGVVRVREEASLAEVGGLVRTKYVLLAEDLDYLSNWTNLARAVRLLADQSWLGVAGAVRNSSGHWRLHCSQLELSYYRLQLRPGYTRQHQDCMVCSQAGGPLVLRTDTLALTDSSLPAHLALLDLAVRKVGLVLACPDLMFFTRSSTGQEMAATTREQWRSLAAKHQFQGLLTNSRKELELEFSCEEANLACDIRSQAAAFLLPWCCYQSFRHILASLDKTAARLGIDYQLESGTCLGAVKLANFIPWDIDMDIEFASKDFHHFKPGGQAYSDLTQAGLKLHSFKRDMYSVKNAGMFNMDYGGITVEMMGSLKPLSRQALPAHLRGSATRIEMSPGLWSPVLSHPGLYARGRYGPGYLYHVQSWRHVAGMTGSYQSYRPGSWQPCSSPGHHACLNNYPIVGNTELLSSIYP